MLLAFRKYSWPILKRGWVGERRGWKTNLDVDKKENGK